MYDDDLLLRQVRQLQPSSVLDVGCGCGSFTVELAPYCREITAIDVFESLIEKSSRENSRPNITYQCMDACQLSYHSDAFDLVFIRASLHHIRDWKLAVDEMLRTTTSRVLILEPLDDPRSEAKRNTMMAQNLFLEIQAEVGYPHYPYIKPSELTEYLRSKGVQPEIETIRRDRPVEFDEYFEPWKMFADKSIRPDHWLERLSEFRDSLGEGQLCESDIYLVSVHK